VLRVELSWSHQEDCLLWVLQTYQLQSSQVQSLENAQQERERAATHASKTYYHRGKTIRPAAQTSQCSDPKPGYREDLEDSRAKAPINLGYILVQSSH
jgi:hypothetical protein